MPASVRAARPVIAIAEKAGVERHTYYRHFSEERDLSEEWSRALHGAQPVPGSI